MGLLAGEPIPAEILGRQTNESFGLLGGTSEQIVSALMTRADGVQKALAATAIAERNPGDILSIAMSNGDEYSK